MRQFEFTFDLWNKPQKITVEARTQHDAKQLLRTVLLAGWNEAACKEIAPQYVEGCYVSK